MIEYITTQEAADKWGITARRVQLLCSQGRIEGAVKKASVWLIPQEVEKPVDGRAGRKASRKKEDISKNKGFNAE
ncbi:DNA-binding protein [Clostridium butyricum]|uniref:DNA-binding protein n=1 Tax=Clostridium TaxID=1485 RepID=UPI000A87B97C